MRTIAATILLILATASANASQATTATTPSSALALTASPSAHGTSGCGIAYACSTTSIASYAAITEVEDAKEKKKDTSKAVPEPTTMLLVGAGLLGLGAIKRRRR